MSKCWDVETRRKAADLFEQGMGYKAVARQLGMSQQTIREWAYQWRSVGREVFCGVRKKRVYPVEVKRAVVRDRLVKHMSTSQVMERYGIVNRHQIKEWCKLYQEQGDDALQPKPRTRKARGEK